MTMFALFPLGGMASSYAVWGWRIPFLVGAVLAGFLAHYYWRKVSESEVWEVRTSARVEKPATARLFSGSNGRSLIQVLIMMTGFWTHAEHHHHLHAFGPAGADPASIQI